MVSATTSETALPATLTRRLVTLADTADALAVSTRSRASSPKARRIAIPDRICHRFSTREVEKLSPASRAAAGCIYTRHHDGQIRQQALG